MEEMAFFLVSEGRRGVLRVFVTFLVAAATVGALQGGVTQEGSAGRVHGAAWYRCAETGVAVLAGLSPGLEEHSNLAQEVFAFLPWGPGEPYVPTGTKSILQS